MFICLGLLAKGSSLTLWIGKAAASQFSKMFENLEIGICQSQSRFSLWKSYQIFKPLTKVTANSKMIEMFTIHVQNRLFFQNFIVCWYSHNVWNFVWRLSLFWRKAVLTRCFVWKNAYMRCCQSYLIDTFCLQCP